VLLHPKGVAVAKSADGGDEADVTQVPKKSPPPTPTRPAATSTVVDGEERGDLVSRETTDQGCQIFLGSRYQNGGKYTKRPHTNEMAIKIYQMAIKIYQIALKVCKWP
jgi:hypothetical protein